MCATTARVRALQFEANGNLLPSQTTVTEQQQRARAHPDPRRILTGNSMIPYNIAARFSHVELLDLLDPAVPLMFIMFDDHDGGEGAGVSVGPPRYRGFRAASFQVT